MKMSVDVLELKSGVSKKGNAYNIALVRVPAGNGKVGKVFSDVVLPIEADVEVELDLDSNAEMFLTPRVRKTYSE